MKMLLLGASALLLATAGFGAQAREADGRFEIAQVMETPAGCQWMDAGARRQSLWCRHEEGGPVYRTGQVRQDYGDGATCPRGQMDNGVRCVREAEAIRSQERAVHYDPSAFGPPPFDWQASKTSDGRWRDPSRPDSVIVRGRGAYRGTYVVVDGDSY